eukprot:CAMPEP_0170637830 /NCGR_PEP_ID=MMETSP0224-20130122/38652_1 /TAXON_ID=285029 /ORGANISM="Togula jolla, Strain CCCM 725" /LENGTH=130 /DNA_ID=CAMNT_0010967799 /DNA_START=1 /DNA_END=390 /DNA_ORIENTATION=-
MAEKPATAINLGPEWLRKGPAKPGSATRSKKADEDHGTSNARYSRDEMLVQREEALLDTSLPEVVFGSMTITALVADGTLPANSLSDAATPTSAAFARRGEAREGGRRARGRGRGVTGRRDDSMGPERAE